MIEEIETLTASTREKIYELIGAKSVEIERMNEQRLVDNRHDETRDYVTFSPIYEVVSTETISEEMLHATKAFKSLHKERDRKAAAEAKAQRARSRVAKRASKEKAKAKQIAERELYAKLHEKYGEQTPMPKGQK